MNKIETNDFIAEYPDDNKIKQAIFDRIIKYFKTCEAFQGESIYQNDDAQIDAIEVMSDIADDILKFNVKWKE